MDIKTKFQIAARPHVQYREPESTMFEAFDVQDLENGTARGRVRVYFKDGSARVFRITLPLPDLEPSPPQRHDVVGILVALAAVLFALYALSQVW